MRARARGRRAGHGDTHGGARCRHSAVWAHASSCSYGSSAIRGYGAQSSMRGGLARSACRRCTPTFGRWRWHCHSTMSAIPLRTGRSTSGSLVTRPVSCLSRFASSVCSCVDSVWLGELHAGHDLDGALDLSAGTNVCVLSQLRVKHVLNPFARFVFDDYTWDMYGATYSRFNGNWIPSRIPLNAVMSGG